MGYKILIVEDFKPSRDVIADILETLGYEYDTAVNGFEAFLSVKNNDFDLVLMDIQMPMLNGFETTEHIRRNLTYPKNIIPVIAMTGWEHASELNRTYKDEGFDGFIEKPFSLDKLADLLRAVLIDSQKKNKGTKVK